MADINKIKKQNAFFIPNFSLSFREYLDIFAVFHTKERVNLFMKKVIVNAKKFYDENREKDYPCPIQINNSNPYVFGVDYGFFLKNLIDFLIEEGGIEEEEEKKKVPRLIYLFYGVDFKNYKMNFPAQVLMKTLFGTIYSITSYKVTMLKGNIFYPFFVENKVGEIYKLNMFFVKKTALKNVFEDKKNIELIMDFFEENSKSFIKKKLDYTVAKELFTVEKNIE
ncbi:hypothetical protein [Caminibacter sp.]